jgi:hypothetical protein
MSKLKLQNYLKPYFTFAGWPCTDFIKITKQTIILVFKNRAYLPYGIQENKVKILVPIQYSIHYTVYSKGFEKYISCQPCLEYYM